MRNTLILVGSVLAITIGFGTLLALLLDQAIYGRSIVRLMVIAPFFVMPTVSALVWKNLLMHPVSGLFAWIATSLGLDADRLVHRLPARGRSSSCRLAMAALRDAHPAHGAAVPGRGAEGSSRDGRRRALAFFYITLPHLARPITVVILIETIFLLTVFAEIFVTTGGGRSRHQPRLPDLLAGAVQRRRRRVGRAAWLRS